MTNPGDPIDLSILARASRPRDAAETPRRGAADVPRADVPPASPSSESRADPPPRRRRATPDTPPRRPAVTDDVPEYRPGILVKPLTDLYVAVGTMSLPMSPAVGTAFVQNAAPCAESLDELARTNPRVRAVLMGLLSTGAWGKVLAAHMPILLAIGVTYSPQVRRAMAAEPPVSPDTSHDTTDTVNPVSNGFVRDTGDVRRRAGQS